MRLTTADPHAQRLFNILMSLIGITAILVIILGYQTLTAERWVTRSIGGIPFRCNATSGVCERFTFRQSR